MTISAAKIKQLIERAEAGQITDRDLDAFFKDPGLWHERLESASNLLMPQDAQSFWQAAWDELLGQGKVTVPPDPKLTLKQTKSLERFVFLVIYLPAITEDQYPAGFVKPDWDRPDWENWGARRSCGSRSWAGGLRSRRSRSPTTTTPRATPMTVSWPW